MKSTEGTRMPLHELKPCPFCGGEPRIQGFESSKGQFLIVKCGSCGAQSAAMPMDGYEGVMCEALWNKRQGETEEAMRRLVKDLEQEMK